MRTASLQLRKYTFETLNCILALVALTSQERFQVAIVRDLSNIDTKLLKNILTNFIWESGDSSDMYVTELEVTEP